MLSLCVLLDAPKEAVRFSDVFVAEGSGIVSFFSPSDSQITIVSICRSLVETLYPRLMGWQGRHVDDPCRVVADDTQSLEKDGLLGNYGIPSFILSSVPSSVVHRGR
jgi:hypothetical protein